MDKLLPSRKIIVFGVLIIVLVGSFLIFSFKKGTVLYKTIDEDIKIDSSLFSYNIDIQKKSNIDSDSDGLKDWEEELWKTNPNNPDTDGDGTNDGDEVNQDRNPLIKAPDDFLGINFKKNLNNIGENETETDIFLKKVASDYINLKNYDLFNEKNKEKLIEKNVNELLLSVDKENYKEYSLKDLKIIKENNNEVLKKYLTEIKDILFSKINIQNNVILLYKTLKKGEDDFKEIEDSIGVYRVVQNILFDMDVPEELAFKHLNLINIIERLISSSKKILLFNDNPVSAIISVKEYSLDADKIKEQVLNIIKYIKQKGVVGVF